MCQWRPCFLGGFRFHRDAKSRLRVRNQKKNHLKVWMFRLAHLHWKDISVDTLFIFHWMHFFNKSHHPESGRTSIWALDSSLHRKTTKASNSEPHHPTQGTHAETMGDKWGQDLGKADTPSNTGRHVEPLTAHCLGKNVNRSCQSCDHLVHANAWLLRNDSALRQWAFNFAAQNLLLRRRQVMQVMGLETKKSSPAAYDKGNS